MYKKNKVKNSISIVFTARNDNYGGDLLDRINALIKVLVFLTNKYKSKFELIIVEYNPPADKKKLFEVLQICKNSNLKIRFIEFDSKYHSNFKNSERIKLFEYTAKNIGIKRATGDFIVSTNQDIIFSDEFIKYLTYEKLDKNTFYRTDRYDVHLKAGTFEQNAESILSYCKHNSYLMKTKSGDKFIRFFDIQVLISILKNTVYLAITTIKSIFFGANRNTIDIKNNLHTFAAGDFLMMHKDAWSKLCGYSESKEGNDYLDSLILFSAYSLQMRQGIISYPMYHVDHYMSKLGRPSMTQDNYTRLINSVLSTKRMSKDNLPTWGHGNLKLKETSI
jgi:hypothetical protein